MSDYQERYPNDIFDVLEGSYNLLEQDSLTFTQTNTEHDRVTYDFAQMDAREPSTMTQVQNQSNQLESGVEAPKTQNYTDGCCSECGKKKKISKKKKKVCPIYQDLSLGHKRSQLIQSRRRKIPKIKMDGRIIERKQQIRNIQKPCSSIHFLYIERLMGRNYIDENDWLKQIKHKNWTNLSDFVRMYQQPDLQWVWDRFFRERVMYRELMQKRIKPQTLQLYMRCIPDFQQAYRTKRFTGFKLKSKDFETQTITRRHRVNFLI